MRLDNFRAVFRFAQENNEWFLFGQLAVALSKFFYIHGLWTEGLGWLKQAESELHQRLGEHQGLEDTPEANEMSVQLTIAELRVALAKFYNEQQECETARQLCENALQVFRTVGQQLGVVNALSCLGIIARYEKKFKEADAHLTEALEIAKVLGDKWRTALILNDLGVTAYNRHHFEAAKLHYTESLRLAREFGDKLGIARALNNLGKTAGTSKVYERKRNATIQKVYVLPVTSLLPTWGLLI